MFRITSRSGQWIGVALALAFALAQLATVSALAREGSAAGSTRILCENKVFDGYKDKLFVLGSAVDRDPAIQKVIRNCTFRNGVQPPIVIQDARNVLIEGNTFENIRTGIPGDGIHAINIPCRGSCQIDAIVIRNNTFTDIGADGVQLGEEGRAISNVTIEGNVFTGSDAVGENAVDVKGVNGPIYLIGNTIQGFRPCESPKLGGRQDCSGSRGAGIIIHAGDPSGIPVNVTVQRNRFSNNTLGLAVSKGAGNIVVLENEFAGNREHGLLVQDVKSIKIFNNVFRDNPVQVYIANTPLRGGTCFMSGNEYLGAAKSVILKNARCTKP